MKRGLILLPILLFVSCGTEGQKINLTNFNRRSVESFQRNYANHPEMDKLVNLHKCVLEKTILLYLDELNDWETIVVDSFLIRQYFVGDLSDHFAFVSNRKRFYFIFIPDFRDRVFNKKYYSRAKGRLENKDTVGNYIVKLNNPFFDDFVTIEINGTNPILDQLMEVDRLLPSIFPGVLKQRLPLFVLNDSLAKKRPHQYQEISKVIEPILADESIPAYWGPNYQIYRNHIGFILLHFKESENDPKQLSVDFYLIPDNHRYRFSIDLSPGRYRDCPRE
jgi:hypothetical protein